MKTIMNDTHALIKIRRKVAHAVRAADEANAKHGPGFYVPKRPYSLCYPDSTGPDTRAEYHVSGPVNAMEARTAAEGHLDMFMLYGEYVQLKVIDRTPFCKSN